MNKKTTPALCLILLIGLSLLLYPSISNYWNSLHQSKAIAGYVQAVEQIDSEKYNAILSDALQYNQSIDYETVSFLPDDQRENYYSQLDISDDGIMGYIKIPSIQCTLPIYHGTSDSVLQVAVGHVEGSSLPVGGPGSHCVLSGHRGLPSARLFTNLDQLKEGDTFSLMVLNEEYLYEVDQIVIVDPEDVSALTFVDGEDYCTLVTCTPYGVNSHRLLVRGHRIEQEDSRVLHILSEAIRVNKWLVTGVVSAPLLIVLIIWIVVRLRRPR